MCRAKAVTVWPRCSSSDSEAAPTNPVAPMSAIFMGSLVNDDWIQLTGLTMPLLVG